MAAPGGASNQPVFDKCRSQHPQPVRCVVAPGCTPRLLLPCAVGVLWIATWKHGLRPVVGRHFIQMLIDLAAARFPTSVWTPENYAEPGKHVLDQKGAPVPTLGNQSACHPCFGLLVGIIEVLHQITPARLSSPKICR